jgi:hypothetical protein
MGKKKERNAMGTKWVKYIYTKETKIKTIMVAEE